MTTNSFTSAISDHYVKPAANLTVFKRFINWCASKQEKRILWQSITHPVHGCIITPIAMIAAMLGGVEHGLFIPVIVAIALNLVVNLAALPTKITIPVFFLSILIDLGVMAAAIVYGLNFSALFS